MLYVHLLRLDVKQAISLKPISSRKQWNNLLRKSVHQESLIHVFFLILIPGKIVSNSFTIDLLITPDTKKNSHFSGLIFKQTSAAS